MNMNPWLTPQALALIEIKRININDGEVYFSKLKDSFEGVFSPATINKALKNLENQGLIECTWKRSTSEKTTRNRWIRHIYVPDQHLEFIQALENVANSYQGEIE